MNRTEAAYQAELELRRRVGEVASYGFEVLKFRLAKDTFYTPDFIVMLSDGKLEAHEVKGFWRDDARAKIKIAAALFPLKFRTVTRSRGLELRGVLDISPHFLFESRVSDRMIAPTANCNLP